MQERQIWTTGRRSAVVCITATVYENSIMATTEADKITEHQMSKALGREFPDHTFYAHEENGYLRADADRWDGDGIETKETDHEMV